MDERYVRLIRALVVTWVIGNVITGVFIRPDQIQLYLVLWGAGVHDEILYLSCVYGTILLIIQASILRNVMDAWEVKDEILIHRDVWWARWINNSINAIFFNKECRNGKFKNGLTLKYLQSRYVTLIILPNFIVWVINVVILATITQVSRKHFWRSFFGLFILGLFPGVTAVAVYLVTMKRFWRGMIPIIIGDCARVLGLYTWGLSILKYLFM